MDTNKLIADFIEKMNEVINCRNRLRDCFCDSVVPDGFNDLNAAYETIVRLDHEQVSLAEGLRSLYNIADTL